MNREEALRRVKGYLTDLIPAENYDEVEEIMQALEQEPVTGRCKWIKYDHRTICPSEHDVDNPYWRIPKEQERVLKYCPYCGKEIEVSE